MKRINHILITAMVLVAVGMVTTATATADYVNISEFNVAEELQSAPLNPDFVTYHANPLRTSIGYSYGYIPPPIDLSHLDEIPVKRIQALVELPSSFDWRDSGNVTPIKNQSTCGTCWTFGTTSVLESTVLINEGAEYNFSEQSVALCVDRSWTYLYDGADNPCNAGGNSFIASEVFINKGSVLESCNPYNTTALNCDGSCVCDDCAPVKRVDGYRLVTNDGLDLDAIKTAVYDHGPVTMSFYYDEGGMCDDPTWGTIYDYPSTKSANHLVSIIGWNDSVPHQVPDDDGDGAWIVKNSWGTGWGNGGYFYLAYNSSSVTEIAYLECKDPVPDEELLYWDEAGFVGSVGYGDSGAWTASVFTADHSGNLTHVDFCTTSNNAEYEIYVWDGYFGSELANQTGTCHELGYYSIPLNTPIPMDAGQQFTVGVNMTTPGYNFPIPVEYEISGTVSPTIQTNVSFIRYNSSCEWADLATYGWNACLRARMVATFSCTCGDICANTSGWWRDGGVFNANATMPIQAAVDAAAAGETICVAAGIYDENVNIGTPYLTLAGEGMGVVTVTAASISDHVFEVTADWVNISGFNVTGATGSGKAGIYLGSVDHCNISDNIASNNYYGIHLESSSNNTLTNNTASNNGYGIMLGAGMVAPDSASNNTTSNNFGRRSPVSSNDTLTDNDASDKGYGIGLGEGVEMVEGANKNTLTDNDASGNEVGILLADSSNNTLSNNMMSGNDCGIVLVYSSNDNTLTSNTANSNNYYGIYLYYSSNNTLSNNMMSGNDYNFGVDGSSFSDYTQTICTNNTVDGKPIYYWVDQQGGQIPTDAGYVGVVNSANIIVQDLNLTKNVQGILFVNTSNSIIEDVTASNNWGGIRLYDSSNNTLADNTANSNIGDNGIYLCDSSNNTLSGNTANANGLNGISLGDSNNNTLSSNTASDNFQVGIGMWDSNNNTLSSNTASGNDYGTYLYSSSNNTLTSNTASNNDYDGIWLEYSSNYNMLMGNTASDNDYGIMLGEGVEMAEGVGSNTASNNFGRMSPVSSNYTLADNDASDKGYGIGLGEGVEMAEGASNNTLTGNNASGNNYGIYLTDSSNNTLSSNTASDNSDWDILIEDSPSNTFTDNTLNGTTVSFTYSGDVSLKGEGSPAADPTGWHNISKFISATNHSAGAWLYLNFSYSDSDLTGTMVESSLTVWKHNGTGWVKDGWDNGRYLDTTGDVVGVNITTFSIFAPMGVPPLHHINVTPTSKTLGINESQDFIARGYAQDGAEISEYFVFEWAISDAYIGSLTEINDTATNFTAEHVGITHITASNGSKTSNEVPVTVDAAEPTNVTVTNGTAIVTSGDVNVTCDFGDDVAGWINITAIGNATNSSDVNQSDPRLGISSGDKVVSGVTVNVSGNITDELAAGNGTIHIEICYNTTTLAALGIDASTLAIWKYDNDTKKWVQQPSTRSGTCVYIDVDHLCTFGLVGSKATGGGSSGGGSGGTYPPGWFGTPTPTVTATKAPANATTAPPGDKVTPVPTKAKTAAAKATAPAAKKDAPGFTAIFVIAGLLAVAYAMMRRRG